MSQQTQVCSNCKAEIAEHVYALHEIYCLRNNVECRRCGHFYDKNDPEAHEEEFHKGTICEHCKQVFQDITKHTNCSKKQVTCLHCGLDFNKDSIFQHENMCGSRTERCDICKQYIMIRDLSKHTSTCVPPKPKELVQEKQLPVQKVPEQKPKYQPNYKPLDQHKDYKEQRQEYKPVEYRQEKPIDYRQEKPLDYRQEYKPQEYRAHEYKPRQEIEQYKQPPQMHAKHEIFGYEKPQTPIDQQKMQRQYQAEKPLDNKKDHSSNRRPQQQQQQQQQQQVVMDYKYKPKEVPLQPTNVIKRQQSGQHEQRNPYPMDKYSQPQPQPHKQLDRKYDPNVYANKYPENKHVEPRQIFEQKFSDQNLHRQPNQPIQQKISQPKPADHELDYLALGLSKEEIEQQKAYLESIQQQKRPEPQPRMQDYKPREYQAARAYK